jgi:hypothetical protein
LELLLNARVFGNPQLFDGTNGDHNKKFKNTLCIILPIGALLIIGLVFLLYYLWRLKHQGWEQVKLYTLEAVSTMTNNFSATMLLGEGGFSSVYRGELADGTKVAVKRAVQRRPGHSRILSLQFQREVSSHTVVRVILKVMLIMYPEFILKPLLIFKCWISIKSANFF